MVQRISTDIKQFKGLKDDVDSKHVPDDYFFGIKNYNYPDAGIVGINKILSPERINDLGSSQIDGLFEYKFLDSNNVLQTQQIGVSGGVIYKDVFGTEVSLKSGLQADSVVTFAIFNDLLYIANGRNYVQVYYGSKGVVSEMGAPCVVDSTVSGNPNGTYYYAMTYVTAGGEDVLGSVSNTVTVLNRKVTLTIPLGYTGTTSRKIYRTTNGGTQLKLLATVADNTTLTYTDNIADASLTTNIPSVTNELPKPFLLAVANQKLYGTKVDRYPTQVFITDTNVGVIDAAEGLDVANYGNDNTPVNGIGIDFGKVIVGTGKNIIIINSDDTVVVTRANVGIKNGYTVKQIPAYLDFPGGLMFVSTLNDVRVMSGLQALPVSTSLDNVRTDDWAQNIRGSLSRALKVTSYMYAEFFDYRYTLLLNYTKFVFDIRTGSWTYHDIQTENYESQPIVLGILNDRLYNGQPDGWIEREYSETQYRDEDVISELESPAMFVGEKYKFVNKLFFWFLPSKRDVINIQVTTDDNTEFMIDTEVVMKGGVFNRQFFNSNYFEGNTKGLDYFVVNVNKMCRWIQYKIIHTVGITSYQGFGIEGQLLSNKEAA